MSRILRITPVGSGWLLLSLLLAAGGTPAAWTPAAWTPAALAADADHLIITEVITKSRFDDRLGGQLGSEFIEVANPTDGDLDLSNVYLTDGTVSTNDVFYWNIAAGAASASTAGGGVANDFHVRFPDGYILAAGDTLSIAVVGSTEYLAAYGQLPDFELFEDANAPDEVPEMLAAFPGAVHAGDPLGESNANLLPALADASESLVLYSWDGGSDLVADVDFVFWGAASSVLFDKTGVTVGSSTYLADTAVGSQQTISTSEHNFLEAYVRLSADEGLETVAGGNGLTGHDETSENLGTTWEIATTQAPPQAPAAHFVAAPIFVSGGAGPASPYAGQDVNLSVTVASFSAVTALEFHYSVDGGVPVDLTEVEQDDGVWTAVLPGQAEAAVVAWYVLATNADGGTATWPAAAPAYSEGWTVGPVPSGAAVAHKLLITEVSTGENIFPTFTGMHQLAMEFVEIHNANDFAVDMSNYYITDAINYFNSTQVYWAIANGPPHSQQTVGGGHYNYISYGGLELGLSKALAKISLTKLNR